MKLLKDCRLVMLLLICLISHTAMATQNSRNWAMPIDTSFNFYQVTPFLYRSALPDGSKVDLIKQKQIATIITFIKKDDKKWLGEQHNIQLISYPTHADRIDDDDVLAVLKIIDQSRSEGKPILLHCKHGQNRTGVFIAMYRIVVQHWTKEQAIAELMYGIPTTEMDDVEDAMAYIKEADVKSIRKALQSNQCSTSSLAFCQWFNS